MTLKTISLAAIAEIGLSACRGGFETDKVGPNKTTDGSRDQKDLSELVAGVWSRVGSPFVPVTVRKPWFMFHHVMGLQM